MLLRGTRQRGARCAGKAALGERAFVAVADLGDPAAADALVKAAEAAMGQLDILVNNAGLTRDMLAMRMKDEDWQKVIDVDLTAGFRLARAALRGMMRRRWGRIIAITSVVGATGNPGQANYAAAKAGMVGMSKALAAEVAHARHHRQLHRARLHRDGDDRRAERRAESANRRRRSRWAGSARPRRSRPASLYLASEEARYVTGQTLHINGGMAMI